MRRILLACIIISSFFFASATSVAAATEVAIEWIEVWANGNVAFKTTPTASTCNGQYIINQSSAGAKNMYATILSAKIAGKKVAISSASACGAADNYGGSYNIPRYIYLIED